MGDRAFLHTYSWAGYFAYPVEVLSRTQKSAKVRLLHRTRIGRSEYPAGTVKDRVPLWSLYEKPSLGAYVSRGGGVFKPAEPGFLRLPDKPDVCSRCGHKECAHAWHCMQCFRSMPWSKRKTTKHPKLNCKCGVGAVLRCPGVADQLPTEKRETTCQKTNK